MKFSKFVSRSRFCLEDGNLELDNLNKRRHKMDILLGTEKDAI